jgi:hypothetical protein
MVFMQNLLIFTLAMQYDIIAMCIQTVTDPALTLTILYHFIAHANPYCKLLYSGEDFISWKNLCPIPICYI